jgi:hypothetical protein
MSVINSPNPDAEEKGDKVEPFLEYSKEPKGEKQIPNLEWKEIAGKNKPTAVSLEAKDEFLYNYLKSAVDGHLKYEGGASSNSTTTTNSAPKTENSNSNTGNTSEEVMNEADEYDDLPF